MKCETNFKNELVNETLLSEIPSMQKTEEELEYTKSIWNYIPEIPVYYGEKCIGIVGWNDNLQKAYLSSNGDYYHTIGITQLENGQFVIIEAVNSKIYADIHSKHAAAINIIGFEKYELLNKFGLKHMVEKSISDEYKLSLMLNKDIVSKITNMFVMETLQYIPEPLTISPYECWDEGWDE